MKSVYIITMYGSSKVYYARVDSLDEAIEIANMWDHSVVQERSGHNRYGGPAKTVYERYNGVVTTH